MAQILSNFFIQRVKNFKQVLAEVDTSSVEVTLEDFRGDTDPEAELKVWEHIASVYQWTTTNNVDLSLEQKRGVLNILLALSMGMTDFSNIPTVTKETVDSIINRYQKS